MAKGMFNKIPKLLKKFPKAIEAGLEACGKNVASDAKILVPEDTRKLLQDIGHQVVIENKKNGSGYVKIGTNTDHGPYVEFGTGIYAEKGGGRKDSWWYFYQGNKGFLGWRETRGQKPQSFLRAALDANKKDLKGVFDNAVAEALKRL